MKNILSFVFWIFSLLAFGQAVSPQYPYPRPLPLSGNVPGGTFRLSAVANPSGYGDNRAAVWDTFIGGGYRSVGTLAERDQILAGRRKEGMLVYVADTKRIYALDTDITSWIDLGVASSGAFGLPTLYSANGTLTGNRTVFGNNLYSLTIQDVPVFDALANTTASLTAPNIRLAGSSFTTIGYGTPYPFIFPAAGSGSTGPSDQVMFRGVDGNIKFGPSYTAGSLGLGGGSVNMYNANGTLTGNRVLEGNNFSYGETNLASKAITTSGNQNYTSIGGIINSSAGVANVLSSGANVYVSAPDVTVNSLANPFKFKQSPNTAVDADYVLVRDSVTGEVRYDAAFTKGAALSASATLYNANGTLSANRVVTGNAKSFTMSGLSSSSITATGNNALYSGGTVVLAGVNVLASGSSATAITAPTVSINSGTTPFLFKQSPTSYASTDEVLGRDPATGEVRYTPLVTLASILSGSGSPAAMVRYVDTVADLVAFDPSPCKEIITRGYHTVGDGGHGIYRWQSSQSLTNYGSRVASSYSGAWDLQAQDVNVLQWGAKRDGVTVASAAIQRALTHAMTNSTRHLVIPHGTYACNSTIMGVSDNLVIDCYGILKNVNGINTSIWRLSNDSVPYTISAGYLTTPYQATNVVVDGHGVGIFDQNGQNCTTYTYENVIAATDPTNTGHCFDIKRLRNTTIRGLTVRDGLLWSIAAELCDNINVIDCKVYSGLPRNATRSGVRWWGGFSDGIHLTDCHNSSINSCYAEASDDVLAVDATRLKCGNNSIINSVGVHIMRRVDPTTGLEYANYMGGSSVYIGVNGEGGSNLYATITNVVATGNRLRGGCGILRVGMDGTGVIPASNILFSDNIIDDKSDQGDTSIAPTGPNPGISIYGANNLTIRGNSFSRVVRLMYMPSTYPRCSGLVIENNKFYDCGWMPVNFLGAGIYNGLIDVPWANDVTIRNNSFNNVAGIPIKVGQNNNTTNNVLVATITGNILDTVNTHYQSVSGAPTNVTAGINLDGVFSYKIAGNVIRNCYGTGIRGRYLGGYGEVDNNTIFATGGSAFTADNHGIQLVNGGSNSSIRTKISNNHLMKPGADGMQLQNTGETLIVNNVIEYPAAVSGGAPVRLTLAGSSLSAAQYAQFGGELTGNTFKTTTAVEPVILYSTLSTTGFTGNKFLFDPSRNSFLGNFIAASYTAFNGAVRSVIGYKSVATSYAALVDDSLIVVTAAGTVTLPTAINNPGKSYTIKRRTGSAVSVASTSSQTFDGVASPYSIVSSAQFVSDGANWVVVNAF